ncbi:MAG: YjfI family protein [Pseudomonadota bacterium]|nr:YjfI family protein [Pseudomonadota bacterium]
MKVDRPRSSTEYVREFRARMRQAGLVKKDVWIRPEFSAELASVERRLRLESGIACDAGFPLEVGNGACWSLPSIHRAIADSPPVRSGNIEVNLLEGSDPALHLVMREFGDLPVFVAVGGLQIVVQALMWPVEHVMDPAAFNAHVLRTHKLLPLSTMGIEPVGGVPCYIMFGSLDVCASLSNVMFEVETLAENVIACADAYRSFLRDDPLPDWTGS